MGSSRKRKYFFVTFGDYVTDMTELWDIQKIEDVTHLKKTYGLVVAHPSYTPAVIEGEKIGRRLSWMRSHAIITKETVRTVAERTLMSAIPTLQAFAPYTMSHTETPEIRLRQRIKIQAQRIHEFSENEPITVGLDGSLIPPNYCGWAGIGPCGPLFVNASSYSNSISNNQAEIQALKSCLLLLQNIDVSYRISTDSLFVMILVENILSKNGEAHEKVEQWIGEKQITSRTITSLRKVVNEGTPQIFKTKGHSKDEVNNYADTLARYAAEERRQKSTKTFRTVLKQTERKVLLISTGKFYTDMSSVYPMGELKDHIDKLHASDIEVLLTTDIAGDNMWRKRICDLAIEQAEVLPDDKEFQTYKANLNRHTRDLNSGIVEWQRIVMSLMRKYMSGISFLVFRERDVVVASGRYGLKHITVVPQSDRYIKEVLEHIGVSEETQTVVVCGNHPWKGPQSHYDASLVTKMVLNLNIREPRNGERKICGVLRDAAIM